MGWFRIYIDKTIDPKTGQGGEHSRFFDCEATDETDARSQLKLEKDEQVNSVVSLAWDPR